jgi:hypothetical protein
LYDLRRQDESSRSTAFFQDLFPFGFQNSIERDHLRVFLAFCCKSKANFVLRPGAILSFNPDSENSRNPKTLSSEALKTFLATLNSSDAWAGYRPMRFSFSYRQKLPGVVVWAGKHATLAPGALLGSRTTKGITPPFAQRLGKIGIGAHVAARHRGRRRS